MKKLIIGYTWISAAIFILLALTVSPPKPPGVMSHFLNGVFPKGTPGSLGSWELVEPFPWIDVAGPLRIEYFDKENLIVLCRQGELYIVSKTGGPSRLILDINERTFKLSDAGSVGFVLHPKFGNPEFPEKQEVYIYYRTKPDAGEFSNNGHNRLSKFKWDASNETFDESSEEILIQQYDRTPWHDGGGMFFGDDGFLYLSIGDEGYNEYQTVSTQRIDGGFFSGVFRIDVDNDPTKSHPIRRQPQPNAQPHDAWAETFTQGYGIPNDNPWVAEDGSVLEEFYALGVRSPFSLHPDPITDEIWVADVGSNKREEISVFTKGDNLQWPYIEGTTKSETHQKPENYIGNEKGIVFEYKRDVGFAIIGGGLYYNHLYPSLINKYIFGDYTANKIMSVSKENDSDNDNFEVIVSNIHDAGISLLPNTNISGVHIMDDGHIYISAIGEEIESRGYILELRGKKPYPDPPIKLSELGVFKNIETLEVKEGILPYDVNSPLWSDGATKQRWIAVPNDGAFDHADEKIDFDAADPWDFPIGTVLIKQFDLSTDISDPSKSTRLETRFFVIDENRIGYGFTYKWNEEGTDAFLLKSGDSRDIDIYDDGIYSNTQVWDFPSRDQCLNCHNSQTKYVLGVNTHQLNRNHDYAGEMTNQLDYFNEFGMFNRDIISSQLYPRSYNLTEKEVPLESRIRSYMDANCASCHRSTYVPDVDLDLRLHKTLNIKNDLTTLTQSHASDPTRNIIQPGDPFLSELWIRDASTEDNKMPPIGRRLVDQVYVDSLAKWIGTLEREITLNKNLLVFPNPTEGWLSIIVPEDFIGPFTISVYNISGQVIYEERSDDISNYLNMEDIPSGIYILVISNGSMKATQKVVIY